MSSSSRSPAVRRLLKELSELQNDPPLDFWAHPLEDNLLEWHFTIRGPSEGGFSGGRYHGRILFPPEYPFKPPNIAFLSENGRFEVGKKICLSITGHHPEFWRPAWGIRTSLTAVISFMPTPGAGAIGAVDWSEEERKKCAVRSRKFKCEQCGCDHATVLLDEEEIAKRGLVSNDTVEPELSFVAKDSATEASEQEGDGDSKSEGKGESPRAPSDAACLAPKPLSTVILPKPKPENQSMQQPKTQPTPQTRPPSLSQSAGPSSSLSSSPSDTTLRRRTTTATSSGANPPPQFQAETQQVRQQQPTQTIDRIIFIVLMLLAVLIWRKMSRDGKNANEFGQ